jgi:predicted GIY-YIG superfamily endonuclease
LHAARSAPLLIAAHRCQDRDELDRLVVYVLESLVDPSRHYCGVTSNVDERVALHNAGKSAHTAKYRPWRLSVAIIFDDLARAARFEKYLKSGSGRAFCRRHFDTPPAVGQPQPHLRD